MAALLLLGLLSISCPLALFVASIGIIRDYKKCKEYGVIIAACLATIAYSYTPKGHSDLTRYFEIIQVANSYSIQEYFTYIGDNLFVTDAVFWMVGRLQIPHIVPAISTFIVYFVAFYITTDYARIIGTEKNAWKVVLIQIGCLNYSGILNNVRNICAFSIIILAVYFREIKKEKIPVSILMYILACFIHESAIVLVLARIVQVLLRKRIIIAAALALFVPGIINYLFSYYSVISRYGSIGLIISNLILTSYRAMNSTSRWATVVMTSVRFRADRYLSILFGIIIFVKVVKTIRNHTDIPFFHYVSIIALLTISTNIFRTPAYWRLYSACVCCAGPIMLLSMDKKVSGKISSIISTICFTMFASMIFVVHFYSSLEEINYIDLMIQTLLSPFALIVFDFIFALFREVLR